jgi:integrase
MAQFDDPRVVEKFVSLPPLLWNKAERIKKTASTNRIAKKAHLLVQSAVAIEILTFAPMRLSNLQGLRLDEHINWMGQRARISIPRQQVKNNQALEYLLPESLSKRIKDYLSNHRGYLGDSDSPYLFQGRSGQPKDCSTLRNQIRNTLWNEAAIKLTPHQFRHAAAKILLDTKPGYYEVVRKVLGHKSLTTTYNHYAGAETQAAINLYDDVIIQHRRKPLTNSGRGLSAEPPFMDPLQFFGGKK